MMPRHVMLMFAGIFFLGVVMGAGFLLNRPAKTVYMPEANNDVVVAVMKDEPPEVSVETGLSESVAPEASQKQTQAALVPPAGESSAAQQTERTVQAYPEKEQYPVGTKEIVLVITNRGEGTLGYAGYYDFRRLDGETITPLTVRADVVFDMTEKQLQPGKTVRVNVPIDLFDEPLPPGTYRAAQAACFTDTKGEALACSEITADFVIG